MNNLRLTIIMFMLAVVIAAVMMLGWHQGVSAAPAGDGRASPVIDPATFAPAGLKQAPWSGQTSPRPKPRAGDGAASPADAPPPEPFALVELFTSEGCSSCPPADQLMSELAAPGPASRRVLCVAFHVDYWDHLGWKDPFASAAFTQRQRGYAASLKDDRVYTPQAIVNGATGLVGSDRRKMTEAIDAALAVPATIRLDVSPTDQIKPGQTLALAVKIAPVGKAPLPDDLRVFVALTEDRLTSRVTRGENQGRELAHSAVCRALADARIDAAGSARLELTVPAAVNPAHARVIVWVQQGATGRVLAATAAVAQQ